MGLYFWDTYRYTNNGNLIEGYAQPKEDTEDEVMTVKVKSADYEVLSDLQKACLDEHLANLYYPSEIDLVLI
jgi:hypothetical protein